MNGLMILQSNIRSLICCVRIALLVLLFFAVKMAYVVSFSNRFAIVQVMAEKYRRYVNGTFHTDSKQLLLDYIHRKASCDRPSEASSSIDDVGDERAKWINWVKGCLFMTMMTLLFAMTTIAVTVCTFHTLRVRLPAQFIDRRLFTTVNTSCRTFMTDGEMIGNQWRPRTCRMHYYTKADLAECMIRSERAAKRRNKFVFLGDSRIREQHQSFTALAARKPYFNLTTWLCYHSSAVFNDDLFDVEFVWNTHLSTLPELQKWLKNPPAFVAISSGTWVLQDNRLTFEKGLNQFKAILTALLPALRQLSRVTSVIWMPQAPFIHEYIWHEANCLRKKYFEFVREKAACRHGWTRNDWLNSYNDVSYSILRNDSGSTYVWTAARSIVDSFAFDTHDRMHLLTGCTPPGSRAMYFQSQMLFNFHCNRFLDPNPALDGEQGELCCGLDSDRR